MNRKLFGLLGPAALVAAGPLLAQLPVGPIVKVTSTPGKTVAEPCVASAPDGAFALAWSDGWNDFSAHVSARWYDGEATPVTGVLELTPLPPGDLSTEWYPSCDWSGPASGPLIAWFHLDGEQPIRATDYQLFDDAGAALSDKHRLPLDVANFSDVAVAPSGAAWLSSVRVEYDTGAVTGRVNRVDPVTGEMLAPTMELAPDTPDRDLQPRLAAQGNAGVVAAWDRESQDATELSVLLRRFAADGTPLGPEADVDPALAGWKANPDVAAARDGSFVVVWAQENDSGVLEIAARQFHADGSPKGASFFVGELREEGALFPAVASDAAGNFAVAAWYSSDDVLLRAFRRDGTPIGGDFVVNENRVDIYHLPALDLAESGLITVAWRDFPPEDPQFGEIAFRRYALPCLDDGSSLCLGGRFRVTAQWQTAPGEVGIGRGRPLGADSGAFWFFDPANLELVVKVLDGCGVNGRHWVYVAGLTDVEVELQILDTWTGEVWATETDPLERFPALQDVEAFGGCGAPAPEANTLPGLRPLEADAAPAPRPGAPAGASPEEAACVADATHLCLQQGRFRVSASYAAATGASGEAVAVPLEADSGAFWFFGPDNLELLVKVLDACEPFERFWVYAAGLTDVGVVMRVEDTQTGTLRVYENLSGQPFAPIHDASAFATCGP